MRRNVVYIGIISFVIGFLIFLYGVSLTGRNIAVQISFWGGLLLFFGFIIIVYGWRLKSTEQKQKEISSIRNCPNCGKSIRIDVKICPYCKKDFEKKLN